MDTLPVCIFDSAPVLIVFCNLRLLHDQLATGRLADELSGMMCICRPLVDCASNSCDGDR